MRTLTVFLTNICHSCSNIAIKVNTKLFSKITKARAWNIKVGNVEGGIPWLNEVPTMVMGLSLTRAGGAVSKTVVTGSVSLDSKDSAATIQIAQDVRIQSSTSVVTRENMYNMTKVSDRIILLLLCENNSTHQWHCQALAIQYMLHNKVMPKRVVVYRNGSSEGNFTQVLETEVAALRKAFSDLRGHCANQVGRQEPCRNVRVCQGNGCTWCTPIITYIVALSQHNIRIVPAAPTEGRRGNLLNVPSGTCVDHTITPYVDGENFAVKWPDHVDQSGGEIQIFEQRNSTGFDFLLTAQGGLKGTSKPIFYRVVSLLSFNNFDTITRSLNCCFCLY
jgi:hypothetical protein